MQKVVLLDMFVCVCVCMYVGKGTPSMTKAALNLFLYPQRAQYSNRNVRSVENTAFIVYILLDKF
jgi:hypothetical protein